MPQLLTVPEQFNEYATSPLGPYVLDEEAQPVANNGTARASKSWRVSRFMISLCLTFFCLSPSGGGYPLQTGPTLVMLELNASLL